MRIIFYLLSFVFFSCVEVTRNDLERKFTKDKTNFETVAQRFLSQESIQWISIYPEYDVGLCQSINRWSNCPSDGDRWKTWDDSLKREVYLNSKDEVLRKNGISRQDYQYYSDFLLKHNLGQISMVFECDSCVEFEFKLNGLRYVTFKNQLFKQDDEYLAVERINDNWFVYSRDWN